MKQLTKQQLRQIIQEEIKSSVSQTGTLKEYGGHTPEIYQMKITNELLTKILNVLSQPSGGGELEEGSVADTVNRQLAGGQWKAKDGKCYEFGDYGYPNEIECPQWTKETKELEEQKLRKSDTLRKKQKQKKITKTQLIQIIQEKLKSVTSKP